jgi:DNA-binding NarL/FixJ family response regulator
VLRLLAEGQSTAAIADALAYSESTIKNMVHDLVHRLGARNRTHAVALAIRGGLI